MSSKQRTSAYFQKLFLTGGDSFGQIRSKRVLFTADFSCQGISVGEQVSASIDRDTIKHYMKSGIPQISMIFMKMGTDI